MNAATIWNTAKWIANESNDLQATRGMVSAAALRTIRDGLMNGKYSEELSDRQARAALNRVDFLLLPFE